MVKLSPISASAKGDSIRPQEAQTPIISRLDMVSNRI